MNPREFTLLGLLCLATSGVSAQSASKPPIAKFMGHEVTVTEAKMDKDGLYPAGPASVCVETSPIRLCYTAPKEYGRSPQVSIVQIEKDLPALLFSAESGGVSGFSIHFALLVSEGDGLRNAFFDGVGVSSQSAHAFWNDFSISNSPFFVTADYVTGPDEAHYGEHRYMIRVYAWKSSSMVDNMYYYLDDQYLTARKYDMESSNILTAEKPEILSRLRRVQKAPPKK